jgi:surface protein
MSEMFSNCSSLESLPDLSKWDISSVLERNNMFENCADSLNIPEKFKDIK